MVGRNLSDDEVLERMVTLFEKHTDSSKVFSEDDFNIGPNLGSGQFGKVVAAVEKKTNFIVALKIINKKKVYKRGLYKQLYYELFIHSQLRHENIIKMFTYFANEVSVYFVLEYATKGTLYSLWQKQKFKRFRERPAGKYIYQVASALKYCHEKNFLHGDLKPENILIDVFNNAKLSDFGYAWALDDLKNRTIGGTFEYYAPELIRKEPYDKTIDHWSLGILMFELLVGRNPFHRKRARGTGKLICTREIKLPAFVSEGSGYLIQGLANKDPKKRIDFEEVLQYFDDLVVFDDLSTSEEEELDFILKNYSPEDFL